MKRSTATSSAATRWSVPRRSRELTDRQPSQSSATAVLLSPVATEMPELMNVLIWVRQGKHWLALANISGAMMIQGTIPKAFCLLFTPWLLDSTMMASSLVTLLAVTLLWWGFSRERMTAGRLALVGLIYLGFCGWLMMS